MRKIFTAIAIVLSIASMAQGSINEFVPDPIGTKNFVYDGDFLTTKSNQIILGSKKKPIPTSSRLYTFILNDKEQVKRSGDTLTVLDKTIRFILVDGVVYEIVRTTEVRPAYSPVFSFPDYMNIPGIKNANKN